MTEVGIGIDVGTLRPPKRSRNSNPNPLIISSWSARTTRFRRVWNMVGVKQNGLDRNTGRTAAGSTVTDADVTDADITDADVTDADVTVDGPVMLSVTPLLSQPAMPREARRRNHEADLRIGVSIEHLAL